MKGAEKFEFTADRSVEGLRLDVWLSGLIAGMSRSRVKQLIMSGNVTLNGGETSPHHKIRRGENVLVNIPPPAETDLKSEAIPLDILFEDGDIIVINKPAGLVVHPAPGHSEGTLVNALLHHCRDLEGVGGEIRPGIVHRLDKDTSGVMVVAKNERAMNNLSDQFKTGLVEKHYLAIVHGVPRQGRGEIETMIGRSGHNRKKMSTSPSSGGRRAVSCYEVVESFGDCSLLDVRIKTGRTHQIRVHMAHMGHHIVGDPQYGRRGERKKTGGKADRQMLHSHRLSLKHPFTGRMLNFIAPIPLDMESILFFLRKARVEKSF